MKARVFFTISLIFFITIPALAFNKQSITHQKLDNNIYSFNSLKDVSLAKAGTEFLAMNEDFENEYEKNYIWFQDMILVNLSSGLISRYSRPVIGKYAKPLPWDAFYEKVGRDDLKMFYLTQRRTKIALYITGAAMMFTGTIVMMAPLFESNYDPDTNVAYYASGGAIMGAGLIIYCVGLFIRLHKIGMPEVKELADKYNKKLKRGSNLQKTNMTKGKNNINLEFSFQPFTSKEGGGIIFNWRF